MLGKKINNWIYIQDKNGNIKPMPKGKAAIPVWKKLIKDTEKARRIRISNEEKARRIKFINTEKARRIEFQKSIPKSFW